MTYHVKPPYFPLNQSNNNSSFFGGIVNLLEGQSGLITFVTILLNTNYQLTYRAYDASGNDVIVTNFIKSVNGFTCITPCDCTLEFEVLPNTGGNAFGITQAINSNNNSITFSTTQSNANYRFVYRAYDVYGNDLRLTNIVKTVNGVTFDSPGVGTIEAIILIN